ncbi:MAG TPA: fibronectin type III domain-containing protein [Spirochaetia bacterium]|nr:fibronectin type III domain-containing protein [Spirochaetia bacterium]
MDSVSLPGRLRVALIALLAVLLAGCDQFSLYEKFQSVTATRQSEGSETLAISPASVLTPTNTTVTFSASGGTPPYQYTVSDGTGFVDQPTGLYHAPGSPGSATVEVSDSLGQTATASVTVFAGAVASVLAISPGTATVSAGTSLTFSAVGGISPYHFAITLGGGLVDSAAGIYQAPGAAGSATITVTDSASGTSSANLTIVASGGGLAISPSSATISASTQMTFGAANGTAPYTYSKASGAGTINSTTGVYQAPPTAATTTIRVTDSLLATSDAIITVLAPPSTVLINPVAPAVTVGATINFTTNGGTPPYAYSVLGGGAGGTVNPGTGVYVAPNIPGTDTVRVTDAYGGISDSTVTIVAASQLVISPITLTTSVDTPYQFGATGGVPPYLFSKFTGAGDMSTGGLYTAPGGPSTDIVRVTDSAFAVSDATVTVVSGGALAISPTTASIPEGGTLTFSGSGGSPSYTFSIASGSGSIGASSGTYTATGSVGASAATVKLTDSSSATATATVSVVPAAPSNLGVANGASLHLVLTWTNKTADPSAEIQIERKVGSAGTYSPLTTLPASTSSFTDGNGSPLSPNTLYIYRIRAVDGGLSSAYSNEGFGLT